jgi:D-3-phosphoglycerate dehydrogenase
VSPSPRLTVAVAHQSIGDEPYVLDLVGDRADVKFGPLTTDDEAAALTEGADAVFVTLQPLPASRIAALAPTVRVIGRAGVGLDTIDLEAAAARKVAVVHEPTYATAEVANHAAALMLSVKRRIPEASRLMENGWGIVTAIGSVPDLALETVGVIGFGAIGRAFAARMAPFFGEVRIYDPVASADDIRAAGYVPAESLDELLAASNAISLHVPLLPQTRGLIGARELALLPDGAVVVNVSRGGLIDERALADALAAGHLGGAGIDVFEKEPLPDDSPLRAAPRLTMTPHVAWFSDGASDRMSGWTVDDVFSVLEGRPIRHGRLAVGADWLGR